jgi:FlaA1/EpsC-like NDP-sugar epimerase
MIWTPLNRFLDSLRPQRQAAVLLADAFLILLAWHTTYLFRLGVERWLHERPAYDGPVLLAVIAIYSVVSWALGVPRATWRYTSFHEITRLAWLCLGAGLASAVVVLMAQLVEIPRAVLALHPVFALVILSLARMLVRMLSESSRARRAPWCWAQAQPPSCSSRASSTAAGRSWACLTTTGANTAPAWRA